MALRLSFFGGAGIVTGSNFLLETAKGQKFLLDCGIEQGRDFIVEDVYGPFPFDASEIDAVYISHAHLDHVGRAPKLMKAGFTGKVYMTPPTRDLAEAILRDSVRILAGEAEARNLAPLYDEGDVDAFLASIETVPYHEEREILPGLSIYLRNTGHILGSSSIRIKDEEGNTFALTSDIGNSPATLLPDHEPITDSEVVLIESVYGDRANPEKDDRVAHLRDLLKKAYEKGGTILMPAFSIERTQILLYEIGKLVASGELPSVPVFLDSPLAISVTKIYQKWAKDYFKPELEGKIREGHLFQFPFLTTTADREESEAIAKAGDPKIIMAGAGMSHGGRIGKWEQKYLPYPDTTLFIVGYQAPGSPGRMLQNGSPHVKIDGRDVEVLAKVETLHGWSGHADRDGLLEFAGKCMPNAKTFFVGLGEPDSERFLAQRIHDYLGAKVIVPEKGETWEINKGSARRI
jgi:metallo-beta-lactamase family protein